MLVLLAAHALAAVCAPWLVARLHRRAFYLLALAPAAAAVWALAQTGAVRAGGIVTERLGWVPELRLELTFRMDTLSWLMTVVVGGIGALVLVYCASYFADGEPGLGRFAGVFTGFAGAMLGLVTADDMLAMYLFWELTTVLSYLLIGHYGRHRASRAAATQALVVTTAGGLAMLVGIVLLGEQAGSYRLSVLVAHAPHGPVVTVAVMLLLVGAGSKSALVPFHFWLPGAMAAPTPVSAYLHAAAMVQAGIYLIARLAPGFAATPGWQPVLLVLGGLTMLLGALRAMRQTDLKMLLAYGTVSQLGLLTVLVGCGSRDTALAGMVLLLAHALYKSALFLVVGIIDNRAGTRDIRELSGLARRLPVLLVVTVLALASMASLPPLLGFIGKEAALAAFRSGAPGGATGAGSADLAVSVVIAAGSALTFAYAWRFGWGAFGSHRASSPTSLAQPSAAFVAVPGLLGLAGLAGGLAAPQLEHVLAPALAGFAPAQVGVHLGLWHGLSEPLAWSAAVVAAGLMLVLAGRRVATLQAAVRVPVDAVRAFATLMRGLDQTSLTVTGLVQRGSMPVSLALILGVWVLLPGSALLRGVPWPRVRAWDSPAQLAVALLVAAAALFCIRSHNRFRAVFLVGVTGYGTAFLFLLHGAPDLALTQSLVETVSIVVFVLVLRRLPQRFSLPGLRANRRLRALLAAALGAVVAGAAVVAAGARTAAPASTGFDRAAVQFGGGHNIVNVILVDIRAWDTMGELSVVLVAATGVASLVFLRRRDQLQPNARIVSPAPDQPTWLAAGSLLTPRRRSLIFEVTTRLIFHTIVLFSLFLLFSGHNNPGGGFAAGLMLGLALVVRYLAGGRHELTQALPVRPGWLLGGGLVCSVGAGLAAPLAGGEVLRSWSFELAPPLLGDVHVVTSVVFDIGVYLVVAGLMLDILRSLGAELDRQIESDLAADDTIARVGQAAP